MNSPELTSPFEFTKPVVGKQFLNKRKELQMLSFKLSQRCLAFVMGYKDCGKTSFALKLIDLLKRKYEDRVLVYISLRGYKSDQEILSHYLRTLVHAFNVNLDIESMKSNLILDPIAVAEFTEELSKNNNRKVVIIIDDFNEVCRIVGLHIIKKLLGSLIQRQNRISICVFSKKTYEAVNLFHDYSSISNTSPTTFEFINSIGEHHWYRYISSIFRKNNQSIGMGEVKHMMSKMNNQPKFMQSLSHYIHLTGKSKITIEIIENVIDEVVELNSTLYRKVFSGLTKYQKRVVVGYATNKPVDVSSRHVLKTYKALKDLAIVLS